ncbi:MAG TPA: glutamate decarboxylase [Firmicutes bacterium]|nr:glutamate decarboxylase [Candidatus Fermentithermobacillaceae bacterium]
MWKVVYVASGWNEAERLKEHLAANGLLVMLRACGCDGDKLAKNVELMVPESEVTEAHSILMQLMGTVRA